MMNIEQTLSDLVSIDSVSSRSNAEIIGYLSQRVQELGLRKPQLLAYTDEHGTEKVNLIACGGPEARNTEVELALVGHTDTVPYDAAWDDALTLRAKEARLYGRGACDTKGFIAAALTAIESIDLTKLRRPMALVFTSDEEVGCLGAKHLVEKQALRARYSIVGEPTSLQPIRAGKGYCLARVVVRGREGHSAYPSSGASAIFGAARLISRLEEIAVRLESQDLQANFDPPFTTLNVGIVSGGTAKNIIPGECRFTLEWRPVPGQKPEYVLDLLERAIAEDRTSETKRSGNALGRGALDYELMTDRIDGGMATSEDSRLVRLLEEATGKAAGTVAFGTEAPQMVELGSEAVIFGPGDIRVAHQTNEFVPIEDLHKCVAVLRHAIEHFCV